VLRSHLRTRNKGNKAARRRRRVEREDMPATPDPKRDAAPGIRAVNS
jgi:hypothetical protein